MNNINLRAFLKSLLFWLLPGVTAGIVLAVFLTAHEYRNTARLAVSVLSENEKPLPEALKEVLSGSGEEAEGKRYLASYGYDKYYGLGRNMRDTTVITVLLFEAAGCFIFFKKRKHSRKLNRRIEELTEYLLAVNRGEAAALSRAEDSFSHLEDAIYKTVMELNGTKEAAVRDHEVLSGRIADIAHQLKTPLTSMSLMTELLEEHQTKEAAEYLDRLKNQVERLKNLVSALLTLAKLDSHTLMFKKEQIDIQELLKEAAGPLREMMAEKKIELGLPETEQIFIQADMQWTSEALLNILKNAVEHTPENGRLTVSCEKNPLYTEIIVEDGGKGFEKKDIPHLFERFYRGQGAAKDSAGIGLALAKLIVESQDGHIQAENSSGGHARFRIRFSPDGPQDQA